MFWRPPGWGRLASEAAPVSGVGPTEPATRLSGTSLVASKSPAEREPGSRLAAGEIASVAAPGAPIVPGPGPLLPAAATTIVPAKAALFAITEVEPAGSPLVSPNERLITSATGLGINVFVTVPLLLPTRVYGEAASSIANSISRT